MTTLVRPLEFCDLDHQAIAFTGTCPICRLRREGTHTALRTAQRPSDGDVYVSDLKRAIADDGVRRDAATRSGG